MGTFFSTINEFSQIPERHFQYAQSLLTALLAKILETDEIDIGVSNGPDEIKSILTFTSDESERVLVHLTYCESENFKIEVVDNSEELMVSNFSYTMPEESILEKMIPEGLRNIMEEVASEGEPQMIRPKTLNY